MLIFLVRTDTGADGVQSVDIAAVEREQAVACYEAQGYRCCSAAEFSAAWQQRDRARVIRQATAQGVACPPKAAEQQQSTVESSPKGKGKGARIYPQS